MKDDPFSERGVTNPVVCASQPNQILHKRNKKYIPNLASNLQNQGYLFCTFAEFFNSAKNSQDCEKWKKTTKFTRILSRF